MRSARLVFQYADLTAWSLSNFSSMDQYWEAFSKLYKIPRMSSLASICHKYALTFQSYVAFVPVVHQLQVWAGFLFRATLKFDLWIRLLRPELLICDCNTSSRCLLSHSNIKMLVIYYLSSSQSSKLSSLALPQNYTACAEHAVMTHT